MELAIFSQALREYTRLKRVLPWLLFGVACMVLAYNWRFLVPGSPEVEQYSSVSQILVYRLIALVSAVYTTAIINQEVEQRTIVYLLTRPVPRWKLLLVRYLVSVLVVFGIAAVCAVLTSFGAFRSLGGNPLLFNDLRALAVGALAYGALFLFISLIIHRAMIVCLLFAFGWETALPNLQGSMKQLSILTYLQAIGDHPEPDDRGLLELISGLLGTNTVTPAQAYTTMGIMIVGLLALSAWWFTRHEYVPREDAE
jgi:ABC-2 type transport system permease protein